MERRISFDLARNRLRKGGKRAHEGRVEGAMEKMVEEEYCP